MANLASMYVEVIPSVRGIGGSLAASMAPAAALASQHGDKAGNAFSHAFSAGLGGAAAALAKTMAIGVGAIATGLGAAGAVGVKTNAQLEQADIAFTTMLGSAEKATTFISSLKDFAKKTPFDFPGLVKSSQNLIAIGISTEKVLPIMNTLGNVTSGMGTGSEGIKRATVALQQMNAAGKITAEDLNQLRDAGIPVYDLLTAATGKSKDEIAKMREEGKLGREELDALMSALETGKGLERFNGLMEAQSQSMAGLWATLKDTFSMGMADIIEPLTPMIKGALGGAISYITEITPGATAGMQGFVNSLMGVGGTLDRIGDAWINVKAGFLGNSALINDDVLGYPALVRFGGIIRSIVDWVRSLDYSSFTGFFNSITEGIPGITNLGDTFGRIGDLVVQLLPLFGAFMAELGDQAPWLLGLALNLLTIALEFLVRIMPTLIEFMPLIVAGFIAWRLASLGALIVKGLLTVAIWAIRAATIAWRATVLVATAAQWLWNAALSANPIALVIIGITLLVGALVWFFTQTEIGRKAWDIFTGAIVTAWNWVVGAITNAWTNYIWPALQAMWNFITVTMGPVWNWLGGVIAGVFGFIVGAIVGAWVGWIWPALQAMWHFVTVTLGPMWNWLAAAVDLAWLWIKKVTYDAFVWLYWAVFRPLKEWMLDNQITWEDVKNKVIEVWSWIVAKITDAWNNWIWPTLQALWWFLNNVVIPVWNFLWSVVAWVWDNIVKKIQWAWNEIIWPLLQGVWDFIMNVIVPVWNFLWNTVSNVWNLIVGVIRWAWNEVIKPILDGAWWFITNILIPVWDWLSEKVGGAWEKIKTTVNSAWTWIKTNVFDPMFKFLHEDVPGAWDKATTFIGDMWNKIKDIAKTPIKWVLDEVINKGFIDTFNKIADLLPGVGKLKHIKVDGWRSGGYTGNIGEDEVAGPVHGKEFVLNAAATRKIRREHGMAGLEYMNRTGHLPEDRKKQLAGPGTNTFGRPSFGNQLQRDVERARRLNVVGSARGYDIPAAARMWNGLAAVEVGHNIGGPTVNAGIGPQVQMAGGGQSAGYYTGNEIRLADGNRFGAVNAMVIAVHEIGHALGLQHAHRGEGGNGAFSVMNYDTQWATKGNPTPADIAALRAVYPGDPRGKQGVNPSGSGSGGDGGGGGGVNPFMAIIDSLGDMIKKAFPEGGKMVEVATGFVKKTVEDVSTFFLDKLGGVWDFLGDVGEKVVGTAQMTAWATEALMKTGNLDPWNVASLVRRMDQESSGNPKAVNMWDSNKSLGGTHGLMQLLQSNFDRYRDKNLPNDIYDPVANIVAAIGYTRDRYGDLRKGWDRKGGYSPMPTLFDEGGWLENTGKPQLIDHRRTQKPDAIFKHELAAALIRRATEPTGNGAIYVQNPFTGEYLIAETEEHAVNATGQAMAGSLTRLRRGGKYATRGGRR